MGGKGSQESIFHDEIEGKYYFQVWRQLDPDELAFLRSKYSNLPEKEFSFLVDKLSHLHLSEMLPFYIMRYGFYEGHTGFRSDPLSIAIVFNLMSISELDSRFPGDLYGMVTRHFTDQSMPQNPQP
jgi:hypothetical protein